MAYNPYPDLVFEAAPRVCFSENYSLQYIGSAEGEITWDFDEAEVISGTGSGPYVLKWSTAGEKTIQFSINNKSCISDTTLYVTVAPAVVTPSLCMVTVDEATAKNKLIWSNDQETVARFGVYRETNVANDYALVTYVEAEPMMTYIDNQSVPAQMSNRYRITAVDSCGVETELSALHKTIHLTINKGQDDAWNLIWDGYEGISFGTYRIYRGTNNEDMELLTEIASNLTSYTDLNPPSGNISYQIEVLNPHSCETDANGRLAQLTNIKSNIANRSTVVTSIDDVVAIEPVAIYPNPTSGTIKVQFETFVEGRYAITTMSGEEITGGPLKKEIAIHLEEQPKGIYFLILNTGKGVITKKIIKQ